MCVYCLHATCIEKFQTKKGETGLFMICGTCRARTFAPPRAVHGLRRLQRMLMHGENWEPFVTALMMYDQPADPAVEANLPGENFEPKP